MAQSKAQKFASKRNWTKRRVVALKGQLSGLSKENEIFTKREIHDLEKAGNILDTLLNKWNDEYHEAKEEYLNDNT